ncbi:MAG: radical SAM protein, partial [Smithellaceae bacterium]|nr:radical SAM protein [Smithellaceae bacterium]
MSNTLIIPVFIMNRGCPGRCVYCRVKSLVGPPGTVPDLRTERSEVVESGLSPSPDLVEKTVRTYLGYPRKKPELVQLAFYGGSFTSLTRAYQLALLEKADDLQRQGLIHSLRISTRPDCLGSEELDLLKAYHVTTVEVGAQSLQDHVLSKSNRGHTAMDVVSAIGRLKDRGFETGMHLMAGLPGDSREGFIFSVEKTIALRPHLVRVHPTLVLAGTPLAEAFCRGEYTPLTRDEAIWAGKEALRRFDAAGIPVIRLGLQATEELTRPGNIIAGFYHPSFRALVEEVIFYDLAASLLAGRDSNDGGATFIVSPGDVSNFVGQRRGNLLKLADLFGIAPIEIVTSPDQARGSVSLMAEKGSAGVPPAVICGRDGHAPMTVQMDSVPYNHV